MNKDKLKGLIIGVVIVAGLNMVGAAWQNPTGNPTAGNPDVPVHVGSSPQNKLGDFGVGGNLTVAFGAVIGGVTQTTGGLIVETRTSDPTSPANGRIWLRTDL